MFNGKCRMHIEVTPFFSLPFVLISPKRNDKKKILDSYCEAKCLVKKKKKDLFLNSE